MKTIPVRLVTHFDGQSQTVFVAKTVDEILEDLRPIVEASDADDMLQVAVCATRSHVAIHISAPRNDEGDEDDLLANLMDFGRRCMGPIHYLRRLQEQ